MSHKDVNEYEGQSSHIVQHWGDQRLHKLQGENRLKMWYVKNYNPHLLKTKAQMTSKNGIHVFLSFCRQRVGEGVRICSSLYIFYAIHYGSVFSMFLFLKFD